MCFITNSISIQFIFVNKLQQIIPLMNKYIFITYLLIFYATYAQENDTLKTKFFYDNDSIAVPYINLDEVFIIEDTKFRKEEQKKFFILQRRIHKVYPYAKLTADNLTTLNNNLQNFKSDKDKKKYKKIVEQYLTDEFEPRLKKLTRSEGQLLVKLIHRQTGNTTFELIKDHKNAWKAFWSNNTAKLFNINLKTTYNPYNSPEDFLIESILLSAFSKQQLTKQEANPKIDYQKLAKTWQQKLNKSKE